MIPVIQDARSLELKQQAALNGRKLKEKPSYKEMLNNETTPEDEKALEDAAASAYNRLKSRYIEGKLNG